MQQSSGQSDDPSAALVGGRYELAERLGEGAFSVTYRAIDAVLGRPVAVKIARAQYASDPEFVARFEREARLAASVSHPNIVDVYDYGPHEQTYFIAMQYVAGSDLRQLLDERRRLPADEAAAITRQVLAGLSAIHAVGIIHRDIKPHNVLVGLDGVARVTDFGVAYTAVEEGLTSQGTTIGTASYMAPEQARGGTLSVRTDLYAVGVMLFECLTGRLPFEAENPMAVMLAHIQRPAPRPSDVAPAIGVPAAIEAVVMRALEKDPADRYPDAETMANALGREPGTRTGATTRRLPAASSTAATATIPAMQPPVRSRPDHTVPPPAPRRSGPPWNRIGAVLFVLLALLAGGAALAGTIGDRSGDDGGPAVVDDASPTPTVAATSTAAAATATGLAIQGAVATSTATTAPTATVTAVPTATRTPTPTATATATLEPSATATETEVATSTAAPVPVATATSTSVPVATATVRPTETPVPVDVDSGGGTEAPTIASSASGGNSGDGTTTISFAPSEWSGACGNVDSAQFGREAVAIRGAESSCPSATIAFRLSEAPAGDTALTVFGFNGETTPVMLAIEINGSRSSSSNQFFDVWNGRAPSIDATWGQARIMLPPGYLQAGQNTITLVSTTSGSDENGPPYVLLGEAMLEF